jgi:hypothetical protein
MAVQKRVGGDDERVGTALSKRRKGWLEIARRCGANHDDLLAALPPAWHSRATDGSDCRD